MTMIKRGILGKPDMLTVSTFQFVFRKFDLPVYTHVSKFPFNIFMQVSIFVKFSRKMKVVQWRKRSEDYLLMHEENNERLRNQQEFDWESLVI